MNRSVTATIVALLALVGVQAATTTGADDDGYRTKVEVRIALPPGPAPEVAVAPSSRGVVIELPAGATYPEDFAASTGGLVRDAVVTPLEEGRTRIELELAIGLLDRVIFTPDGLTLRFNSRYEVMDRLEGDGEDQYRLGPDDKITVQVHGHEDLTTEATVSDNGFINVPLVGDVEADGLTPRQLASRLGELLGRDYLVDPQVDIDIKEFRSQWVMVAGEIRVPGRVSLRGGTRLKEVLSEAGGFGSDAGELITITRNAGDQQEVSREIARADFEDGLVDPVLGHGDIITVSKAKYAYLQGEVGLPNRVRIERGTTLLQAITQVGGLTDWANKKQVQIIAADGGEPKTYNLKKIQNGHEPDPELYGGEIIVVKRRFF